MTPEESTTPDLAELGQRLTDAINARDFDAVISFYAPDAVWDSAAVGLEILEGRAAIRGFFEDWVGAFENYEGKLEEVCDLGNGVTLVVLVLRGRPLNSSGWVERRYGIVNLWRDGVIMRVESYQGIDEARAAAERLAQERR
jgi:ketosteroid isomerase-like protein